MAVPVSSINCWVELKTTSFLAVFTASTLGGSSSSDDESNVSAAVSDASTWVDVEQVSGLCWCRFFGVFLSLSSRFPGFHFFVCSDRFGPPSALHVWTSFLFVF